MATATLQEVKPVKPNVILTLTPEEAEALRRVLSRVGGEDRYTRRRHTNAISRALDSVGYEYQADVEDVVATGSITFRQ